MTKEAPATPSSSAAPGPAGGSNNIKVVCRFRPQNDIELREGGQVCIAVDLNAESVVLNAKEVASAPFNFDRVFDSGATQREIFEYSVKSIVDDVVAGYNGTVFAYGQTGSGKTYTMMGSSVMDELSKGVTPRIVENIFCAILNSPSTMEYTVKVAYMEIYMEKIRDLLNPSNDNLPIHEEKSRGVYVKGLLEVYVSSVEEVFEVMQRGSQARAVSYTNMNSESSRSHSIFLITITQKNTVDGSVKSGRLFLVDLAGSEKIGKTGASGQTLEEAKKINKSLSALGMVINALTDGKHTHIPYRDSKLTRILQESLGGNSRTTLIINCSPSSWNVDETLSTLRFGMRAKCIKNKAKINAELSAAELKTLLRKAKQEAIAFQQYARALEEEVEAWRARGTVPKERQISPDFLASLGVARSAPQSEDGEKVPSSAGVTSSANFVARPLTPCESSSVDDDEREEFLRRENELTDSLAEKETEISEKDKLIDSLREELREYRASESEVSKENKELAKLVCGLRRELERVTYENKEALITLDSVRESNIRLNAEFEVLKVQMREAQQKSNYDDEASKETRKRDKMEKIMAQLDPSRSLAAGSADMTGALAGIKSPDDASAADIAVVIAEAAELRKQLDSAHLATQKAKSAAAALATKNEELARKMEKAENRLVQLETEYEDMMDKFIAAEEEGDHSEIVETVQELKTKVESHYTQRIEQYRVETEDLKVEIRGKNELVDRLNVEVDELRKALQDAKEGPPPAVLTTASGTAGLTKAAAADVALAEKERDLERVRKATAQQIAEFEMVKRSMMQDLQNRCEKVVELEMALDETREHYNTAAKAMNSKSQQKKMAFLERNLLQLTNIQKQLVEQNASLKKEVAVCERKLAARNDRIESLEAMMQDAQERLASQDRKFEQQLAAVRERLEQARMQRHFQQQQQQQQEVPSESQLLRAQQQQRLGFPFGYGRIAKPVRGGGGALETTDGIKVFGTPTPAGDGIISSPPASPSMPLESTQTTKRTSWLGWPRS